MKWKTSSIPAKAPAYEVGGPSLTVPDQSLSLKEILARFTRGEPLALAQQTHYGSAGDIDPESNSEFNIDQEKAKSWDLTERDEFRQKVSEARQEFEQKEKRKRAKAAQEKAAKEKAEADKKVAPPEPPKGSI